MDEVRKPKASRWLRILLAVSLTLNLLVVGLVVGIALRFDGKGKDRSPPPIGAVLFKELPREDRKALHREAFGERKDRHANRQRDARAVYDAIRAVPFDPAPVRDVLEKQSEATLQFRSSMREAWLQQISSMTDAERGVYAERFLDRMQRGPEGHKKKPGH